MAIPPIYEQQGYSSIYFRGQRSGPSIYRAPHNRPPYLIKNMGNTLPSEPQSAHAALDDPTALTDVAQVDKVVDGVVCGDVWQDGKRQEYKRAS